MQAALLIMSYKKEFNGKVPIVKLANLRYGQKDAFNSASRHVTIAVSGFLSENAEHKDDWG